MAQNKSRGNERRGCAGELMQMATEIAKQENLYSQAFGALQESGRDRGASWIKRLRENAMDRFKQVGFPSVKEEEWKYTNVAPIARIDFNPSVFSDAAATKNLPASIMSKPNRASWFWSMAFSAMISPA